jgi:hypothetical protein
MPTETGNGIEIPDLHSNLGGESGDIEQVHRTDTAFSLQNGRVERRYILSGPGENAKTGDNDALPHRIPPSTIKVCPVM